MGKFLKILRYIANLIATMGATTSTPQKNSCIGINSTRCIEPSDFIPEGPISDDNRKKCFIQISGQYRDRPTIYITEFTNITCDRSPCFIGSGGIPSSYEAGILKSVCFHKFGDFPSVSIFRTRNGFVIKDGTQTFNLPNFSLFLKGEISTGDFLDGIFVEYPMHYNRIWEILNSSRQYTATYQPSLFDAPLKVLKTVRDDISGDIILWSVGQSQLKVRWNQIDHDINEVLFRKNRITVAKIDFPSVWNIFNNDPILCIEDKKYPLPDYISVLSGVITEEQFIEKLYLRYSESDVEKIWKVLTDKKALRRSIY
jgi:hypothetical protein